ncbi:7278_t:CDS:1, partial [Racocetra fulgida]
SQDKGKKEYSHCNSIIKIEDFCCPRKNDPQYKYSTSNKCYEQCKNRQKEVDVISSKRKQLETNLTVITGSITAVNSNQTDLYIDLKQLKTNPTVITGSITAVNSSQTDLYMDLEQDSNASEDSAS